MAVHAGGNAGTGNVLPVAVGGVAPLGATLVVRLAGDAGVMAEPGVVAVALGAISIHCGGIPAIQSCERYVLPPFAVAVAVDVGADAGGRSIVLAGPLAGIIGKVVDMGGNGNDGGVVIGHCPAMAGHAADGIAERGIGNGIDVRRVLAGRDRVAVRQGAAMATEAVCEPAAVAPGRCGNVRRRPFAVAVAIDIGALAVRGAPGQVGPVGGGRTAVGGRCAELGITGLQLPPDGPLDVGGVCGRMTLVTADFVIAEALKTGML
ncbi:hypothetical protein OR1_02863 [Geobacter sp. OR-1]|nr:hypothetical protein OR1_02863 [Geobacter sp. OR-1]